MALRQLQAEHFLHQRGQAHLGDTEQPAGQFGVEQGSRPVAQLVQAGQVLTGRVQHRLGRRQRRVQAGQVGAADRVDQHGAEPGPAELDQEGPLAVAEAGGTLGVHRYRPLAVAKRRRSGGQRVGGGDHAGQPVTGLEQRYSAVRRRWAAFGHGRRLPCEFELCDRWGITRTPAGAGGRPAAVHSASHQAAT